MGYIGESTLELILPNDIFGNEYTISNNAFVGEAEITWISIFSYTIELYHPTKDVKKVVIPSFVKEIGEYAFFGMVNLEEITISNSTTIVDELAFTGNHLKKVYYYGSEAEFLNGPLSYLSGKVEIEYLN